MRQQEQLRTLLLDFNERLAINEMSMKNAEAARTLLLQNLTTLTSKMDDLRDLPREIEGVSKKVDALEQKVEEHQATFLRMEGGAMVGKFIWMIIAGLAGFIAAFVAEWFLKKGGP